MEEEGDMISDAGVMEEDGDMISEEEEEDTTMAEEFVWLLTVVDGEKKGNNKDTNSCFLRIFL